MKNFPLLLALFISIGLIGCNSDSDGGTGISGGGGSLSESELVAFAYQISSRGTQTTDDVSFQEPVPQSLIEQRTTTITVPCSVGSFYRAVEGDVNTYEFNNCEDTSPDLNITNLVNGKAVITLMTPYEGFFHTQKVEFEDLVLRHIHGNDFIENRLNGNSTMSASFSGSDLTESDGNVHLSYRCGNVQGSLNYLFTGTAEKEVTSEGARHVTDYALSVSNHGEFNGDYVIVTQEPVYYQSGRTVPYMGKQAFTLPNGQTHIVRYEASGLFIEDEFYAWDDLINVSPLPFPSFNTCFNIETENGSEGGPVSDTDVGPVSTGATAAINGDEYHAFAAAKYSPEYGILSFNSMDVNNSPGRSISISVQGVSGPGAYIPHSFIYLEVVPTGISWEDDHADSWNIGDGEAVITVEVLGPDLIEGTFSGTLYPNEDNSPDKQYTVDIKNGIFSAEFLL